MRGLELRRFVAPEFFFGVDARKLAARYARNLAARKVLIVTDPGVIAAGWANDVAMNLQEDSIPYVVFSNVSSNPRAHEIMEGVEVYKQNNCNVIISVGGGSPTDCAKGIAIVSTNGRHILDFEGIDKLTDSIPPLICIPTTGGTSADVSQFCIITNMDEHIKIAIVSKVIVPDVALIDPITLTTMDACLSACTGMDAMTHAIEAFVSLGSSPFTDVHALAAIRILNDNLIDSVEHPNDIELRSRIMLGSLEAGLAFSNASLGGVHAMAHSLGGLIDLPHGECNSMLLRHVIDFNFNETAERYIEIGKQMGLDLNGMTMQQQKNAIINRIDYLSDRLNITKGLGKKGVALSDIPVLAKNAFKDACMITNPRRPKNARDIEVLYEEAT